MNRYPLWKYAMLVVALLIGLIYTLPNFFGEAPAVQVSSGKVTVKINADVTARVEKALADAGVKPDFVHFEGSSVRARFGDTDTQIKAKDAISKALNPDPADTNYIVALNLVSRSPTWLTSLHAFPMYLGLDLRGGVHFLMQVDMKSVLSKKAEALTGDVRSLLRDKNIRHAGINRQGNEVVINFREAALREQARDVLRDKITEMQWTPTQSGEDLQLVGQLLPAAMTAAQENALKQNITTLHNRVNELAVSEPVIQQQGLDRIVVQLPGVQDTAKAKDIIGRTATLQFRLVTDVEGAPEVVMERLRDGTLKPVGLKREVYVTGDRVQTATAKMDENQRPAVGIRLDEAGGRAMKAMSRDNVGKPMAIVLYEKGKGEAISVANINTELSSDFQITGNFTTEQTTDLALLTRAGSLAAPMEIIEERTIGPSLGAENIAKGFNSVLWGFVAVAAFMCVYYMLFGVFSSLALGFNLLLLVAVLSMMQATLSLPGMAAIALVLGMAIDSNVLINERVREELRAGAAPQTAIFAGYERAFATILDSNVTTLIAGVALLAFGSGPVKGFAVVHCLGILTSMFSSVVFSRGLVNLWYGRQKKLKSVSIGTVWRPEGAATPSPEA
ncbi:protein translocase subunit SecD [Pelomonas sp. SE-A7]|uniref:protein translocase subunit SecD n=1 Tax=Pelomonas sp. SE-A7 TaxID=3054953 RepID=UPI00259D006F|nr:protein translocase subunit SecD [Pelomonas sp. SE-A7]MDM4766749.1 protein translocase subunit SecD [Pelomonas sp. SE-A7]